MDILLVEDNPLKREKVREFIVSRWNVSIAEAASYNSAISRAKSREFDLLILDMSMPTFDRTETDMGGRFRVFGGKEIAVKLKKKGYLPLFVILTGYSEFKDESGKLNLNQISDLLTTIGTQFIGVIPFDSAKSEWKEQLAAVIEGVNSD